jgi:uncharacterized membrane protein YbaN (DUF454 family)
VKAVLKRWLKIITGMAMLIAGVIGWLLPVIPGWAFFIPGLVLLSHEFHWARRLLNWLKSKFPKQTARDTRNPN